LRRVLVFALIVVVSVLLAGCNGSGGSASAPGASAAAADAPNGELASKLDGAWTSSAGQTLAWKLAGDKGKVTYVESFDGVDPAETREFKADVDVAANGADFEYGDGANLMRVRYLTADMLIAERISTTTKAIIGTDTYGRTKDAAVQAATAFMNALPGTSGAVGTKPGETSYYDNLVNEGLLVPKENAITATK
jgi:hypothetical protein